MFAKRVISTKCEKCLIKKKGLVKEKSDITIIDRQGDGDILFVLEMPEYSKVLSKFKAWLAKNLIDSYQIAVALQCQTEQFEIPSPIYKTLKNCNTITHGFNSKVIVTIGRAMSAITQSDDLTSWRDFAEYQFNQSYFITPYHWKDKLRVYPIPSLYDWLHDSDCFEGFFTLIQINEVKKYLKNYEPVQVEPFTLHEVEDPNSFLSSCLSDTSFSAYENIAWDLETKHLKHFASDFFIICLTLSFNGKEGYYLPFEKINKRLLTSLLRSKSNILANGKFDIKALHVNGVRGIEMEHDVTILHHCLNTQRMTNGIKSLAWLIGLGGYDRELDEFVEKNKIKYYSDIPKSLLMQYAMIDSIVTYRLYEFGLLLSKKQPRVFDCYKDVMRSIPAFMEMEINGIKVDTNYTTELSNTLKHEEKELEQAIYEGFKTTFDINSFQQLARTIEDAGWPCYGRSDKQFYEKNGDVYYYYNVGENQLDRWEKTGFELAGKIIRYRVLTKLRTSFLGEVAEEVEDNFFSKKGKIKDEKEYGLVKHIQPDGLIHPTYSPGRTDSIRSAASDPNPQQWPKQGPEGKLFRKAIACPDDWYIVEADFSGFQLRIGAIYSGDEVMKDIFLNRGGDMHSITAQGCLMRSMTLEEFIARKKEDKFKNTRFKAKSINFGFIFGMAAYSFRDTIFKEWKESEILEYIRENNCKLKESNGAPDLCLTVAEDIRTKFFETYPGLMPWIEAQHEFAKKYGFVESWHGIRRHLPQMKYIGSNFDRSIISNLENISVNSPVQAFEAIVAYQGIKRVYDKVKKYNLQAKFMSMVHDSLVFYCPKHEVKTLYHILKDSMEDHTTWDIPILIDVAVGKVWGFGEEIEKESDLDKFSE